MSAMKYVGWFVPIRRSAILISVIVRSLFVGSPAEAASLPGGSPIRIVFIAEANEEVPGDLLENVLVGFAEVVLPVAGATGTIGGGTAGGMWPPQHFHRLPRDGPDFAPCLR